MKIKQLTCSILFALTAFAGASYGDDTELYLIDTKSNIYGARAPQVLVIFDNSGSMNTEVPGAVDPYDPNWSDADYTGPINDKAIYWNVGGIDNGSTMPVPDDPNEWRRFELRNNNCQSAAIALKTKGRFTGYLAEYTKQGGTGSWTSLAENNGLNTNGMLVECQEDTDALRAGRMTISEANPVDFSSDVYPINSQDKYQDNDDNKVARLDKGLPVTLYSEHYLKWFQWASDPNNANTPVAGEPSPSRLGLAKTALKDALQDLEGKIDVGLAVFNINHDDEFERDGGRIVSAIKPLTSSYRSSLDSLISTMPAQTNTPLCETLYEAYLYFAGKAVDFGDNDRKMSGNEEEPKDYVPNTPPQDLTAQQDGNYLSPFKTCPQMGFVIYITDGVPTLDQAADSKIQALLSAAPTKPGVNYTPYPMKEIDGSDKSSYLPALASYMYNNDLVKGPTDASGSDNQQSVRLITIGFSEDADAAEPLLKEAALRGGGSKSESGSVTGYYSAHSPEALVEAITSAFKTVLAVDSSFTSPSIASNNFDKTQTFNAAYYAMFLPNIGPRWSGNLKKLKVSSSGELVGPGGVTGVINANGSIGSDVCTFWNNCGVSAADGNKVLSGGVLPTLRSQLLNRKIVTDSGSSLVRLTDLSDSSLANLMDYKLPDGTIDPVGAASTRNWLYGMDVDDDNDDGSITDARNDVMGDPLHSKPLALNFGSAATTDAFGNTIEHNDVRILVGTNQGLVHMFKDVDGGASDFSVGSVSESWAFIPTELLPKVKTLRRNLSTGAHSVYGMDLSPVAYTEQDATGKVSKAYVYLGMRRGGTSYYALDISNPDNPKFLWSIKAEGEFAGLAQTWSEPVVTRFKDQTNPVLVFGGGFDEGHSGGNGVYLVDAVSGSLIAKYSVTGMSSIPNKVAVLDANNDGYTDRIYATDVEANVWRIDRPEGGSGAWSAFKFADLGGNTDSSNRNFFAEPVVAQTALTNVLNVNGELTYQNLPYDAVAIGSGKRPNPLDTSTEDMFFVLQDRNVVSKVFSDAARPQTLTLDKLYDVTAAAPSTQEENVAFGSTLGWYYNFGVVGEKTLSAALIFDGKVYFTSFIPPGDVDAGDLENGVCAIQGQGRLYVLDLHKGTRTYDQVYYELGERVPDTPQIVIPPPAPGEESKAYIIGVGKGEAGEDGRYKGTINLGTGLSAHKIYFHVDE